MRSDVHVLKVKSPAAVELASILGGTRDTSGELPGVVWQPSYSRLVVPYNARVVVEARLSLLGLTSKVDCGWTVTASAAIHSLETAVDGSRLRLLTAPGLRSIVQRPGDELALPIAEMVTAFQAEGIKASVDRGFGLLRWPTGSGKSLGGIVTLASQRDVRGIIVTRATNRIGFAREIARYTNEEVDVLEGVTPRPLRDTKFCVLGWETLPAWARTLIYAGPYAVLFDEIHKCRNRKRTQTWEDADGRHTARLENMAVAALDLSRGAKDGAVWASTATPIDDRPKDMWAPLDLINPGGFGSWNAYVLRYCQGFVNSYGGLVAKGKSNADELRARLAAITHDVPESVVEAQLPGADVIFTEIAKQDQCGAAAFAEEIRDAEKRGATAVERSHCARAATKKRPHILDRAEEIVEGGKRFAVFTGRRLDAEKLAEEIRKRLKSAGLEAPVFMIHGEVSQKERQTMIDSYAATPAAVMVGTTDSIGESINGLQGTRWLTFAQLPDTPGKLKQAMGRIKRFGQVERATIELAWAAGDAYDETAVGRLIKKLPALREIVGDTSLGDVEVGLHGDSDKYESDLFSKIVTAPADDERLSE